MTSREQQEQVRAWLQSLAEGHYPFQEHMAGMAVVTLNWIAELGRHDNPGPVINPTPEKKRGPMLQIRVRGPLSITEIEE